MPRSTTLSVLADLGEEQWGLFTRRQAEATGLAWSTLARLTADGGAERVARGVYRLRGAPSVDHLDLRAAWLQLAPETPAWKRTAATGVVSHRSAASLYGFGHLPADVHQFTLPVRRQSRRGDVRLHRGKLIDEEWTMLRGLPVTRPSRIAVDLLAHREDLAAVGHLIADALRGGHEHPRITAAAIAPLAARFAQRRGDGAALLSWLLELGGAHESERRRWRAAAGDAPAQRTPGPAGEAPR
jgi:predicted transcriptional regulator of viral defense system